MRARRLGELSTNGHMDRGSGSGGIFPKSNPWERRHHGIWVPYFIGKKKGQKNSRSPKLRSMSIKLAHAERRVTTEIRKGDSTLASGFQTFLCRRYAKNIVWLKHGWYAKLLWTNRLWGQKLREWPPARVICRLLQYRKSVCATK